MQKKSKTYQILTISNTKLYYDDLDDILQILSDNNLDIEITDNENIYDSLEELKELKGKYIPSLTIMARSKVQFSIDFVQIVITNYATNIHVWGEDLMSIGYYIEKIVSKRVRKKIYNFLNASLAEFNIKLFSFFTILSYLCNQLYKDNKYFSTPIWLGFTIFWIIVYIVSLLNPNSNTTIQLERKHTTNFFLQNKDKLLLVILTSIITTLLGLSISALFR